MKASIIYWYSKSELRPDGGGLRALAWEAALREYGYDVDIVPLWTVGTTKSPSGRLSSLKKTVIPLPFSRKAPDSVFQSDLVVATALSVFGNCLERLPPSKLILDWMDLWSSWSETVGGARLATRAGGAWQGRLWQSRERRFSASASSNTFAGFRDFTELAQLGARGAAWIPTPVDYVGPPGSPPKDRIGFFGNLNYLPNQLSLRNFLSNYGNALTSGGKTLVVAGFGSEIVRSWPYRVEVLGAIEHPSEFYSKVSGVVVPIDHGSGIKVKAVEAMAYGRPVYATDHVRDGFSPDFAPYVHDLPLCLTSNELAPVPAELFKTRFQASSFNASVVRILEEGKAVERPN